MKFRLLFKQCLQKSLILLTFIIFTATFSIFFVEFSTNHSNAYANEVKTIETLEQLKNTDVSDIAALSEYDSRNYGIVTPVKDQGSSNLCWAYASISASETSILRSGIDPYYTKDNLSLSPEALGYSRYFRPIDPLGNTQSVYEPEGSNWNTLAGNASYCASMLTWWAGPIGKNNSANANPFENALFHCNNAVQIKSTLVSDIKLAIAKYGAVTFSYNNVHEYEYYNPNSESGTASYPHACTLIGWNDNIPSSNFKPNGASKNGGWLVKNSYNSLPYFWLSYDVSSDSIFAFDFTAKQTYDYNYFYDYKFNDSLNYSLNIKKACEIFEAKMSTADKTEYLKAVNVGFIGKNVTAKVDIYVDMENESNPESGKKVGSGNAIFDYGGFRTINLTTPVALKNGQKFACVVELNNPDNSVVICNMTGKSGNNAFIYKNYWQSTNNYTPRIKAFTSLNENNEHEDEKLKFTIMVENGIISGTEEHSIIVDKNQSVTINAAEIEGKTFKGWSIDGGKTILSSLKTYTFTATSNLSFVAVFEDKTTADLSPHPSPPNNKSNWQTIAGISVGSICFVLFLIYIVCYFTIYRKKTNLKNKALEILYKPMNMIFKKKK